MTRSSRTRIHFWCGEDSSKGIVETLLRTSLSYHHLEWRRERGSELRLYESVNLDQSIFRNFRQTGEPTSNTCPVGVRWPLLASIRKTTILSDFWFSAKRNFPVGSISKLRGILPWVEVYSTGVSVPLPGSTAKTVMVSLPRLEA